jgi:uncharacterized lipoprotein YmbA
LRPLAAALLAATVLCGCRASPVHYYVLAVVQPQPAAHPAHSAPTGARPVRVEHVRLPGEIDRSQLVRRLDANRLQIEADSRWAAPLDEMIRRVLSDDLRARLPPGSLADPYQPAEAGQVRSLRLDIHELYGTVGCGASLSVTWTLQQPQAGALGATEDIELPGAGGCPAAQAAAMSRVLAVLSERIAAALARPGT